MEPCDIEMLDADRALSAAELFALLRDNSAVEWTHKVGVAGPVDGSGKSTTRLLAVRGVVVKTRLDLACASKAELMNALAEPRAAGLAAGIWHPEKRWAVLRAESGWLPLVVCPELVTLRRIEDTEARFEAWSDMLQFSLDVYSRCGLGLDLNPSNFATMGPWSHHARLYYVDEETVSGFCERDLASAIVARIPEVERADAERWREWGAWLRRELRLGSLAWDALLDEIQRYPVAEMLEGKRKALAEGIAGGSSARAVPRPALNEPRVTICVFADVHGNLAALDAVLEDAAEQGATQFLFLGDAVGYGPHPNECVQRLAELGSLSCVRGNHDDAAAAGNFSDKMNSLARRCGDWTVGAIGSAEKDWLSRMPIEQCGERWLAVHGAPQDQRRFLAYVYELTFEENLADVRERGLYVCFVGHTHVPTVYSETRNGALATPHGARTVLSQKHASIVNPGSVGQPRDGDARASYALWKREGPESHVVHRRVAYDIELTLAAIRRAGLPEQLEVRLQKGS